MGKNTKASQQKIESFRKILKDEGLDGFLVPYADEFQNEYPPVENRRLEWLTGFSGSSGYCIVLADKAVAMSDGRYMLQIKNQVDKDIYDIADMYAVFPENWLAEHAGEGAKIGYNPWHSTPAQIAKFEKALEPKNISLVSGVLDPIATLWEDRPDPVRGPVELFPGDIAGQSAAEKREILAQDLKEKGVAAAIITMPDSIAWLLNIRGSDIPMVPVALSYALLREDGKVEWFIDPARISKEIADHLGPDVRITAPEDMEEVLRGIKGPVLLDFKRSAIWFQQVLEEAGVKVQDGTDPCVEPRAIKTEAELNGMRETHIRDGVALAKMLCWLDQESSKGALTEGGIGRKIDECREASNMYRGPSFPHIVGFNENGAIIHYHVPPGEEGKTIQGDGMVLIDTGGQYVDGTTDLTRTIAIGEATDEMKTQFTKVLKGHIAVALAQFPDGTTGAQVDALARQPLWNAGQDFAHGTGHGVGVYLCVHEESANISPKSTKAFKPGMIITNEPGYYKEGAYGIRIETIQTVVEGEVCPDTGKKMLHFETLSLVPMDVRLIVKEMLSKEELGWLNAYHRRVRETLSPHLDGDVKSWLEEVTKEI